MHRETGNSPAGRWKLGLSAAVLVLVVAAIFGRVCGFDFTLWDDPQTVSQNPLLNPPSPANLAQLWQKPIESLYIPVTYSVWVAVASVAWLDQPDAHGYRLNPYLFHGLNLVLHLACVLAVWRLLLRLVENPWAALAGALVFAVHPLQVEAVAWISGAKDLLYALLSVAAMLTFMDVFQASGWRRIALYWSATLLLAMAILAKPTAMVVPLLVIALAWEGGVRWRRNDVAMMAGWFVLSLVAAVVTRMVQTGANAGPAPPFWLRPFVAFDAITFYLFKLVIPRLLVPDYGRSPIWLLDSGWWKVTWILPVAVLVGLGSFRPPRRIWLAILLFLIPLIPVLGLVTFNFQFYSTVADHYLYLPMVGVALLAAELTRGATALKNRKLARWAVATVAPLLLCGWATASFLQAGIWQNSRSLFEHTLAINPTSFVGHYDLGVLDESENKVPAAVGEFRAAIALRPAYLPAHAALGSLLIRSGHIEQGLTEMTAALELTAREQPEADLSAAYANIAQLAQRSGQPELAKRIATEGLQRYPGNSRLRQLAGQSVTTAPSSFRHN